MADEGSIVLIKDLRPTMRNVNCAFIVLEKEADVYKTKDGSRIRSCKVADKTGSINFSAWDDIGELIEPGDIFKLKRGYVSLWKGCTRLYMGRRGTMERLGEICMVYSEVPDLSDPDAEFLKDLKDSGSKERGERKQSRPNEQSRDQMSQSSSTHSSHQGSSSNAHKSPHHNQHRFHSKHHTKPHGLQNGSRKPANKFQPYPTSKPPRYS